MTVTVTVTVTHHSTPVQATSTRYQPDSDSEWGTPAAARLGLVQLVPLGHDRDSAHSLTRSPRAGVPVAAAAEPESESPAGAVTVRAASS